MTFLFVLVAICLFVLEFTLRTLAFRARRRRIMRRYNLYSEDEYEHIVYQRKSPFSDWLKKTLRRRNALKKVSKFLVKKKHIYVLKNKYVMVNFDSGKRILICIDVNNMKNSVTASPDNYDLKSGRFIIENLYENFDLFFDTLCVSFDVNSDYEGISKSIKKAFAVKEKSQKKEKPAEQKSAKQTKIKTEKININEATEEQLTNLPGVSVVQAKKTINRINLKGEFKTVEDFYTEMKIKSHFQENLNEMIFVSPCKIVENNEKGVDRIIDL